MPKRKMTASLPPTPCTSEMRASVERVSEERGVSLAEIQRSAIALFLARNERKSINIAKKTFNQGVQS